jgi:PKD repeat protein
MQRHLSTTALAGCLLSSMAMAQFTVVVPNGTATTEANSSNAFPWGRGTLGSLEIQTIYDSTNFTVQGITYPIVIQGLRYRANGAATSAGGTYAACTVDMASATVDALTPTITFATNMGPDLTQVYAGPVTVLPTAAATPGIWSVTIPLTTNFIYDPSLGNDLVIFSHIPPPATSPITGNPGLQLDVMTTGSLSSRVYNSSTTVYPNATGTIAANHGVVVELTYVPAAGLYPAFSANVTAGNSPLAVNFTDSTYSSAPGGVSGWAWDFDGDNVIDSNLQNPSFIYTNCGTYNVSLTVTDSQHSPATLTKTGYIVVDQISANFTASPGGGFAPLNVQFTDTSTGPVTGWSWDLDGDTIPDSNAQNPVWVYATPGTYTVSLTTTNACRTSTLTRPNLIVVLAPGATPAPPELLQYQFNEVRGTSVANTASGVGAPASGTIVNTTNWQSDPNRAGFFGNEPGFGCLGYRAAGAGAVNTGWTTAVTGSFSTSFWLRKNPAAAATPFGYAFGNGTFRSFVGGAAGTGITFRGSAIGNVDSGFTVNNTPGVWQHLTLVVDDAAGQARWYDNGNPSATVVNFTPNTFAYTSAILFGVGAISSTGGSAIGLNGYDLDDFRFYLRALNPAEVLISALLPENPSAGAFGSSCPGPGGTPVISGTGVPSIGNASFAINLSNAEDNKLAAIVMGFTPAANGVISLAPWLGAGCELQTDAVGLTFYITAANAASQPFPIPGSTAYAGLHVYGQWLVLGTTGAATRLLDCNLE